METESGRASCRASARVRSLVLSGAAGTCRARVQPRQIALGAQALGRGIGAVGQHRVRAARGQHDVGAQCTVGSVPHGGVEQHPHRPVGGEHDVRHVDLHVEGLHEVRLAVEGQIAIGRRDPMVGALAAPAHRRYCSTVHTRPSKRENVWPRQKRGVGRSHADHHLVAEVAAQRGVHRGAEAGVAAAPLHRCGRPLPWIGPAEQR